MKTWIFLIIYFVLNGSLQAQSGEAPLDLRYRPTQGDLKAFMNRANNQLDQVNKPKLPCQVDYSPAKEVNLEKDYACFIVPESRVKDWLLAKDDTVELSLQQNNDAAFWKIKDEGKPNKNLSDDVGYTLGLSGKYSRENSERYWNTEIKSDLMTKKVQNEKGDWKNFRGQYYLQTLEQTRVNFEVQEKTDDPSLRVVGRVGLKYDSEKSDGLGAKTQNAWHENLSRYSHLRYEQMQNGHSKLSGEAQVGLRKILDTDISKFNCQASATVLVGADTTGKSLVTTRVDAKASTGELAGRDKDTPLFVIYMAQEKERRGRDELSITQAEAGSYVWAGKETAVYLGVGRVVYRSPEYTKYTRKEEPIHSIHLRVKKAFQGL